MATKSSLFANDPKPKKKTLPELSYTLPLPIKDKARSEDGLRIEAVFTGYTIDVTNTESIRVLCLNGGFGQGMRSRAFPACLTNASDLPRKRRWNKQAEKTDPGTSSQVCDNRLNEPLCLFLEEAFFLIHTLNILRLKDLFDRPISALEAFDRFRKIRKHFLASYCAYLYLKSKNWIIKSGLKFGGDFVIYVKGPQFNHASYIVLIQAMVDGNQISSHIVDGLDFQGFNRIAETTAKDILFLEVFYPATLDLSDTGACLERLKEVRVAETFTKHHNYLAARNQS